MSKIVEGFEIPEFTPLGRYILIPALHNVMKSLEEAEFEDDGLVESETELSEKDFQTVVLAKGEGVSELIEPGDKIQILPQGDWWVPLTIDEVEYFLIRDHVAVGLFK